MYFVGVHFEARWKEAQEEADAFANATRAEKKRMIEEMRPKIMAEVKAEESALGAANSGDGDGKHTLRVRPRPATGKLKYTTRPSRAANFVFPLEGSQLESTVHGTHVQLQERGCCC